MNHENISQWNNIYNASYVLIYYIHMCIYILLKYAIFRKEIRDQRKTG